jgi:hypothetical protein
MARVVLINTLMFMLPFAFYAIWLKTRAPEGAGWRDAPFLSLFGVGVLLVVVTMAIVISFGGYETGKQYRPAVFEDGVLKPGRFE